MLRLRLGHAAICSGLPILAHHGHSANMGTKSRGLHLREHDPCLAAGTRERANLPVDFPQRPRCGLIGSSH
jgi:hypothetical protein